jgi:hypothetical protein
MNHASKSSDAKKQPNSMPSNESQQIAWHRTTQPTPTKRNRFWLILATVFLFGWLIALGILARLS